MPSLIGIGNGQILHVLEDPSTVVAIRSELLNGHDDPYKLPLHRFHKVVGGDVWIDVFTIESVQGN